MAIDYRALATRWFEDNWNRRRDAIVDELLAPESVGHMQGGDVRGREEFRAARAALLGAIPDLHLTIEDTLADGNQVAVRWHVVGTHRGDHFGFAASQRAVDFRGITWLRFDSDRLVEGWDAWNHGALMQALQASD